MKRSVASVAGELIWSEGSRNEEERGEGKSRERTSPPQASRSLLLLPELLHLPGLPPALPT